MEVCETISEGSGEVFRGQVKDNYPEKNRRIPIRYYKILFKIALNSLFNEWGVYTYIHSYIGQSSTRNAKLLSELAH